MALIRWQPYSEMDSIQREINRLFDSLTTATQKKAIAQVLYLLRNCQKLQK